MAGKRDSCGGHVPSTTPEREALIGMAEIEKYSGFSENVLKRLTDEKRFPMCVLETKWISSKRRVDEWFYEFVGTQSLTDGSQL